MIHRYPTTTLKGDTTPYNSNLYVPC